MGFRTTLCIVPTRPAASSLRHRKKRYGKNDPFAELDSSGYLGRQWGRRNRPTRDLATELLDLIPRHRIEDVVYFNPADLSYPVGFNLLGQTGPDNRHLIASGIVGVFKNTWSNSWGPRMEYVSIRDGRCTPRLRKRKPSRNPTNAFG